MGSGPRMRERILGWTRGVVGTKLRVVRFLFLSGWPRQQQQRVGGGEKLKMGVTNWGTIMFLGGHFLGPPLHHCVYLSSPRGHHCVTLLHNNQILVLMTLSHQGDVDHAQWPLFKEEGS